MSDPFADWPPIIRSAQRPKAILWRDTLLTLLMWAVLFSVLYSELAFALSALEVLLGRSEAQIDAELELFFRRMQPLIRLVAALVLMLAIATVFSRRRRSRALTQPQPAALSEPEIAAIAGLEAAGLALARSLKIATVAREQGGLRVEPSPDTKSR